MEEAKVSGYLEGGEGPEAVQAGAGVSESKLQRARANSEYGACLLVLLMVVRTYSKTNNHD